MTQYLEDIMDNELLNMDLLLGHKELSDKLTRDNKHQSVLQISDKTKSIGARYFGTKDQCREFLESVNENEVYHFKGTYSEKFNSIIISYKPDHVSNPNWGNMYTPAQVDQTQSEKLFWHIAKIRDAYIRQLLGSIFNDKTRVEKFLTHPAATKYHHNFNNGLVTHVLEMLNITDTICDLYPKISRDLLYAGCILHDIGKIDEIQAKHGTKSYTKEGNYISHIPIGFLLVSEHISKINGFPEETRQDILHMILSHHGRPTEEIPSIIQPKTLEAEALHLIDMLSSQVAPLHQQRLGVID